MGRPVKKSKLAQFFIVTSAGSEVIIEQTGTRKYKVASGDVFLVNKSTGFAEGEGGISCQPFGGGAVEVVSKITQHRCTTFEGNTYTWVPKDTVTVAGQAELNPVAVAPITLPSGNLTTEQEQKSEPETKTEYKAPKQTAPEDKVPEYEASTKTEVKSKSTSSKRKSKAKASEKSKPIEDLLTDLDQNDVEA